MEFHDKTFTSETHENLVPNIDLVFQSIFHPDQTRSVHQGRIDNQGYYGDL